jgi:acetyl-CoA carboxylase biotin carboxylase subunit
VVSPHYDSLLAKLIVHADSREAAIERMRAALAALQVEGPPTAGFQRELLQHPDFVNARVSTRWVENTVLARA